MISTPLLMSSSILAVSLRFAASWNSFSEWSTAAETEELVLKQCWDEARSSVPQQTSPSAHQFSWLQGRKTAERFLAGMLACLLDSSSPAISPFLTTNQCSSSSNSVSPVCRDLFYPSGPWHLVPSKPRTDVKTQAEDTDSSFCHSTYYLLLYKDALAHGSPFLQREPARQDTTTVQLWLVLHLLIDCGSSAH